ncbi:hypothetical protein [Nonlabens xiamenensis]|uniref:hypothetical protein n=1 Tax=Nonlabens xiamenensis TaxID=2341043 RepID=UPI000F611C05|nr:hypothetical protein [Nonlabens xiamenensis]
MKSLLIPLCFILLSLTAHSQIGINTSDPKANLHIAAGSVDELNGILLPRMDEFPALVSADQDGLMIYCTGSGTPGKGYWYYEDGSGWKKLLDGDGNEFDRLTHPKFPDGMKGIEPITADLSLGNYTIPAGKNLYITSTLTNSGSAQVTLNVFDSTQSLPFVLVSNTRASYAYPSFQNPLICRQNDFIGGNCVINGFIADATVDPIYATMSYMVPAGKIFVYLNSNQPTNNPINEITIDGMPVAFLGTNNADGSSARPSAMPLFADEGQIVHMRNSGVMNGYLINK